MKQAIRTVAVFLTAVISSLTTLNIPVVAATNMPPHPPFSNTEKVDPRVTISSPVNGTVVEPNNAIAVVVDYEAWSLNLALKNKQKKFQPIPFAAIELLLDGESVGLVQLKKTNGRTGSATFSILPDDLPDNAQAITLQARGYSIYQPYDQLPPKLRELMKEKINQVVAESDLVTVQVGAPLEAPNLRFEKQDASFVLSWDNAAPSITYTVQRKIDDGTFETLFEGAGVNAYTDSDLDTMGIYTYQVIATNSKGESKVSDEVTAYVSELGNGLLPIDDTGADTDSDDLTDFLEANKYLTDINNPDTDGDGLKDGDEAFKTFTDPSKADTDDNGVTDDQEDFDGDGLTNIDEIAHATDPLSDDSDLDELNDYDEINTHHTDPNKEDTDEDGLSDGNEVSQGADPLVADSDNDGIKDGDEVFRITTEIADTEKDTQVAPSVTLDVAGKNLEGISISKVGEANPLLQSDMPGYIGAPFDFVAPETFENARITFSFAPELLQQPEFEPAIYYFNETTNLLELLPNQVTDLANHTVSAAVDHFSTYLLLNKPLADAFWAKEMKPPFEGEIENIELVIGFSIDSSGSMTSNDPKGLRKQTAKEFVDKMDENDKAAVIDFDSTAKVLAPLTDDKVAIKNAIDRIDSSGGTNLGAGVQKALEQLQNSTSKAKYIIMLTDGVGTYNSALTQQAIDQGVTIYTIGLGSSVDVTLLQNIANATGGRYFHASSASDLDNIFEQTSEETIDLTTDSDNDGLSDYHEKRGMRANTFWIFTDATKPDSDADGLLDGEELVYQTNNYFEMKSHPDAKDTDSDGINDKLDAEPMVYSITDRTLALAAGLSYVDLAGKIGHTVGSSGEPELSKFTIVDANNSGYTSLNDFFDSGLGSVAIKISRGGKKAAVIFAIRGTEGFGEDLSRDKLTDVALGVGLDTKQSKKAFKEYKELTKAHPNADFFITGHSLGGRLTQDVLYKVYDDNDGAFGLFEDDILTPVHSATFNALGYNKAQFFGKWLFKGSIVDSISSKLNNYYYEYDLVGDGLGASTLFKRLGTDVGPWVATKDSDGNPIPPSEKFEFSKLHSIILFLSESLLSYPNIFHIY